MSDSVKTDGGECVKEIVKEVQPTLRRWIYVDKDGDNDRYKDRDRQSRRQ